jgi:hypothetical protein
MEARWVSQMGRPGGMYLAAYVRSMAGEIWRETGCPDGQFKTWSFYSWVGAAGPWLDLRGSWLSGQWVLAVWLTDWFNEHSSSSSSVLLREINFFLLVLPSAAGSLSCVLGHEISLLCDVSWTEAGWGRSWYFFFFSWRLGLQGGWAEHT